MILLDDRDMEKRIRVDEILARCLDMWDTSTTPLAVARYIGDQVPIAWPPFDPPRPEAVRFLLALVTQLPPQSDDKRVSFHDAPALAARNAVPWNYGDCVNLMVAMGWGNTRLQAERPTVREFGEEVKAACNAQARALALKILEEWERKGHVYRIS